MPFGLWEKTITQLQTLAWCAGNSSVLSPTQIKKKGTCMDNEKPTLIKSYSGWYHPPKVLNSSSRIYFYWNNTINFKLILLTLLFKFLFFLKKILTAAFFWLLFSIIMQWGFCKYVLSKKIKTDIINKSTFRNRN